MRLADRPSIQATKDALAWQDRPQMLLEDSGDGRGRPNDWQISLQAVLSTPAQTYVSVVVGADFCSGPGVEVFAEATQPEALSRQIDQSVSAEGEATSEGNRSEAWRRAKKRA